MKLCKASNAARGSDNQSRVTSHRSRINAACGALLLAASLAYAQDVKDGGPYVPTPQTVVDAMLDLAKVGPRDFVVDLGSGDGRIVLTAAQKYKARGFGVDIDQELVDRANGSARRLGIADRAQFLKQDVHAADLSKVTVLTLYLLPGMMANLRSKLLKELRPGVRVVSHDFDFGDWKADRSIEIETPEKYDIVGTWTSTLHLWIVPAGIEGAWRGALPGPGGGSFQLEIKQDFQRFEGKLARNGREVPLKDGRIDGASLRFSVPRANGGGSELYSATVKDGRMAGEMRGNGTAPAQWSASRTDAGK